MLGTFLQGARYVHTGARLLNRPGVRPYVLVPLCISALLFTGGLWWLWDWLSHLMHWLLPAWLSWLQYLIWPVVALAALMILYFGFSLLANLIGAPFNGWLAGAVARHLGGGPAAATRLGNLPAEILKGFLTELRKLGYILLLTIPFLLLLFVPVVGAVLWFFFTAWLLAYNYVDYPMSLHGLDFAAQRRWLSENRWLCLGFGAGTLLLSLLPLINFIAMPAAVAGATAMYLDRSGSALTKPRS
ncbi:MAG TPA: sulfate transporter CysZ [Gammaproteobacteria bacterium]|nr:sulfate transporter CysZ [Gammaproteobacteria bacterium]